MPASSSDTLTAQIAERAAAVEARIAAACARTGRSADEVTLIAVTKTFPLNVIEAAVAAGLRDLGENRVPDLVAKATAVPGARDGGAVRWHLIGHLQRNKSRDAARYADAFHALDSPRLARALDAKAEEAGAVLPCFVQVNVSGEASKGGVAPDETHAFLDSLGTFGHLRAVGLMTLAAPAAAPDELERVVRPQFQRLRHLAETYPDPAVRLLSMGMSGDYEVAVEEGATHVRVGSALFGARD